MRRVVLVVALSAACRPAFRECGVTTYAIDRAPARLSETGLYEDVATETLAPDVHTFTPRFALWTDGAIKERWIHIPLGAKIDDADPNAWRFPVGTKLWKAFTRDGVRVETRMLALDEGGWTRVAYVWDGADAYARPEGLADAAGTTHDVPSAAECGACHGNQGRVVLGFSAVQLPAEGRDGDLGLDALVAEGWIDEVVDNALPGDDDVRAALGYLHANCSHCHDGPRATGREPRCFDPERTLDFRLRVGELATTAATATYRTAVGEVVGRGGGGNLLSRVRARDAWVGMPALGTELVDERGVELLTRWDEALRR